MPYTSATSASLKPMFWIILERATAQGRVVVTLDADFHVHLAVSGAEGPSVVRLRIEGLGVKRLTEPLLNVLNRCERD
jgi:predicted nuclease of predicted toxin-antitoxin system